MLAYLAVAVIEHVLSSDVRHAPWFDIIKPHPVCIFMYFFCDVSGPLEGQSLPALIEIQGICFPSYPFVTSYF